MAENRMYDIVDYVEAVNAVFDKMQINKKFYGEIISDEITIEDVILSNGFRIEGDVKKYFFEHINQIRKATSIELLNLENTWRE